MRSNLTEPLPSVGEVHRVEAANASVDTYLILEAVQACLDAGDFEGAVNRCREAIARQPDHAPVHRHLSELLGAAGERASALRHARRACELQPSDAANWCNFGHVLAVAGQLQQATQCFIECIRVDARCTDGWHNLGTALMRLGKREEAFKAFKRALLLDPTRADTYFNLGNLLIESEQFDDAVECFERAARHDPTLAVARHRLAEQLSGRGEVNRAESLFRQSLGLDPNHVQGWFSLGRTLEDLGEAHGALKCYRNVMARVPAHAQALGQYLALVKDEADPEVLERAESAMTDQNTCDERRALIGYGLLKYHDQRRNYAAAAAAGSAANAARRRGAGPLDREALQERIGTLMSLYTADFFATRGALGLGTDQPVFIVGLPRSGTTLTEQILSAHPLLHGAGELPDLARIAQSAAGEDEPWRAAARLTEMGSRERGYEYLKALRAGARKGSLRISDKSPLNFFQLAFAALLFPRARVVHCTRSPRDNALSIWMENFNPGQRYATDFGDLAFFHAQYQRLMGHWAHHLPLPILELKYEDTVRDTEGQARRLLDFLGVGWDARCLEFHRSSRSVQTPSRWQVRQPIYASSVARWRHYAPFLPGLEQAFASQAPDGE
jgi:tetratricopeptide (TPR) repeat protein